MTLSYDTFICPEINDVVAEGNIPIVAVCSVEQHGSHPPV